MCQVCVMAPNSGRNSRASRPGPASSRLSASSFTWPPRRTSRKLRQTAQQNHQVRDRNDQQERGRDERADDATDLLDGVEPVLDGGGGRRDRQRGQDDDRGMAEREPQSDRQRTLAILHQFADDVVDGGDVVGVHRVAQPEHPRQQGDTEQGRAVVERRPGPGPRAGIGRNQTTIHRRGPAQAAVHRLSRGVARGPCPSVSLLIGLVTHRRRSAFAATCRIGDAPSPGVGRCAVTRCGAMRRRAGWTACGSAGRSADPLRRQSLARATLAAWQWWRNALRCSALRSRPAGPL